MPNYAFVGQPRCGKTLLMTWFLHGDYTANYEIFVNYKLMFPAKMMSPYDMLRIPFTDVDRHPKTLAIQEMDKWFDSRRSMRNENVLLSSLTGQSGKRNLNIYGDTQFWYRTDSVMRDIFEVIFHVEKPTLDQYKLPIAFNFWTENMGTGECSDLKSIPSPLLKPYYSMYDSYDPTIPLIQTKSMKQLKELYQPDAS